MEQPAAETRRQTAEGSGPPVLEPDGFRAFWSLYPRKIARQAALKAYGKAVKRCGPEEVMLRLQLMLSTEWRGRDPEYIPHASTFLNREDWGERTETLHDDVHPNGLHYCDVCRPAHEWTGREDILEYRSTCPEEIAAMRKAAGR